MTIVVLAALAVLVIAFLLVDHRDDLRLRFGASAKAVVPPMDFDQLTMAALVLAVVAVLIVMLGLGAANAWHRLACNTSHLAGYLDR